MRYLRAVKFSDETVKNPNLYPYNVLHNKTSELLVFDNITLIYGENGAGKSTFLNLLADKLKITGAEPPKPFGKVDFWQQYLQEMLIVMDETENGRIQQLPETARYIKSEDILYEVKKIQQEAVLREGYLYQRQKLGMTKEQLERHKGSDPMETQIERQAFAQEKYSNGETALQVFEDYLLADSLILLDEPEVSLAPEKQLELAKLINQTARLLDTQFIVATHSPLLLGALAGTIYNFSKESLVTQRWQDLPIVKLYRDFFNSNH